jgi:flagellar hook-length control protein FliK
VPRVASDAQVPMMNRPLPPARPAPASDQAPPTPFESVLDDSAQAAPDRASPPRSAAKPADRPDRANQAAKTKDNAQSVDAKSDDAKPDEVISADVVLAEADDGGKTIKANKKASNFTLIADGKPAADTKITEPTASSDNVKAASDGKPADGQMAANIVATPAPAPVATVTPTVAVAQAPASAPDAAPQAVVIATANAAIVATAKAKPTERALPQASASKPTTQPKFSAKAASQPQIEDKPQATVSDADKGAVTQARGEAPANDHRAAATETSVTLGSDTTTAAPKPVADAVQPAALTLPTANTPAAPATNAVAAAAPTALPAAAIPLASVAIEITTQASAGRNHFEIRLDPPELGRIEVRLDVDHDGNVTTRMIADRSDTLDLLRRDATGLERALQDAGLKTADNSLQFSLRDHSSQQQQDNSGANTARLVVEDTTLPQIDIAQRGYSRLAGQGSGIDIHV